MRPTLASMAAPMSVANAATASRRRRMKAIQLFFAVALMVVTFAVFLPRIADYGSVWEAVRSMSTWQVALLAAGRSGPVDLGPNWMVALQGLGFWQSFG